MPNLTVLLLDDNAMADLGPLTHLDALRNLLAGNRATDVTALQDLPALRPLDLRGNPVRNLTPLGDVRRAGLAGAARRVRGRPGG